MDDPRDNSRTIRRDVRLRRLLGTSIMLRMGVIVFVWLVFTLPVSPAWHVASHVSFHLTLFGIFGAYVNYLRILRNTVHPMRWMAWINVMEVSVITALAWETGGTASPMTVLFLMVVMGAVFLGNIGYVMRVSLGVVGAYGFLVALLWTGVLPQPITFIIGDHPAQGLFNATFVSTVAFMVVFFSLFTIMLLMMLYRQIVRQDERIRDARDQVRAANGSLLASFHELTAAIDRLKVAEEINERAKNELLRAERVASVGRLAAANLHELRSPLTIVIAELEMLLLAQTLPPETRLKDTLKKALANASRMKALVQSVEDAVRPASDLRFVEVDLNMLISRSLGLMAYEMKRRSIRLTAVYDPSEPRILGVPSQIEQVILNMLANAAEACPEQDGHVTIETAIRHDSVNLTVADNGAGLSEEEVRDVFKPFFTAKNRSDQLGLGLYVVATIVDRHKGHIAVESQPGKRTAFTVTLPIAV